MELSEQVAVAVQLVKSLFVNVEQTLDLEPKGETVEQLKEEVRELRRELAAFKRLKRGVKPRVEDAVRLLLEAPELAELSIPMIAEIIREVYASYKVPCGCSDSSVRWYQSQRGIEWNIVRRKLPATPKVEVDNVNP